MARLPRSERAIEEVYEALRRSFGSEGARKELEDAIHDEDGVPLIQRSTQAGLLWNTEHARFVLLHGQALEHRLHVADGRLVVLWRAPRSDPRHDPRRQQMDLEAIREHIVAEYVLDGETWVAYRDLRYSMPVDELPARWAIFEQPVAQLVDRFIAVAAKAGSTASKPSNENPDAQSDHTPPKPALQKPAGVSARVWAVAELVKQWECDHHNSHIGVPFQTLFADIEKLAKPNSTTCRERTLQEVLSYLKDPDAYCRRRQLKKQASRRRSRK